MNLRSADVDDQKLTIRNPKSGKTSEMVFIPKKLANRLKDYIKDRGMEGDKRIFPISYTAARVMVRKAGTLVGVHLRPHDLRRHAATYASRIRSSRGDRQQGHPKTRKSLHHPKVSGEGQRC